MVVEVVVLVPLSRVLGSEETIRSARFELIITNPSFSRMPSIELGAVFTGSGEGVIILIGGGTVLDLEGKFCPTAVRLSTGIKAM